MIAPCGRYTKLSRGPLFAMVLVCAVNAGTMQSNSGSPKVMPAACKKVRRGRCFLVMNIAVLGKAAGSLINVERNHKGDLFLFLSLTVKTFVR